MSGTTTKSTILIVPGSFSAASHYDTLIAALHALSYPAVVSDLPSASRLPPAPAASMADDAAHFHGIAESLADEGRDIVIVTHSYGGVPGTEAAKGLAKVDREAEGKKGGVIRLVYLTSIVPAVGGSLVSTMGPVGEAITINVCVPKFLIYTPLLESICKRMSADQHRAGRLHDDRRGSHRTRHLL